MLKFFITICLSLILVLIIMNENVSSYIEQKYHYSFYPQHEILQEASVLKRRLERIRFVISDEDISKSFSNLSEPNSENDENLTLVPTIKIINTQNEENQTQILLDAKLEQNASNLNALNSDKIIVKPNEEFLLIGDSLMQGVAVSLMKDLKKLGIKSTNLSKQNTGLAYKSYFDWSKAVTKAFAENKNIKYLAVLLGPNDPWAIKNNGVFLAFGKPEWQKLYADRVSEILEIAKKNKVNVFWYEVVPMKKADLEDKMAVLNQIYEDKAMQYDSVYIKTRESFLQNGEYSAYLKNENNQSVRMRADDGVHFSGQGAALMSKLLTSKIIMQDNNESMD